MEEFGKQARDAESRFFEYEQKRMKLESDLEEQRRKREEEHELCMQQMLMQSMQQMLATVMGGYQRPQSPPFTYPYTYPPTNYEDTQDQA